MQMLFLQSAIDKMDDNFGRAAIVENGSPLFTGGTASGESQIRRWLLENDLIEAIIGLPYDLFYNTGIATYIWVLSKNKRVERKGKIQLIDATSIFHPLRKSLGNKRNEISTEDRSRITKLYSDFENNELSKIYSNTEFIYREFSIMQPLQRSYGITLKRVETLIEKGVLNFIYDEAKVSELELSNEPLAGKDQKKLEKFYENKPLFESIISALRESISGEVYYSPKPFVTALKIILKNVTDEKKIIEKVADGLSVMDKKAEIQKDRKGNMIFDKDTKDSEIVPLNIEIEQYMKEEVWPYIPDAEAFFEEDLGKKKPVIKTGAEIPFSRCFYKYVAPVPSDELELKFMEIESSVNQRVSKLFSEV